MDSVNAENVLTISYDELHKYCYEMVDVHVDYKSLDSEKFVYLMGYYPAIYNYFSELYTVMIHQVRIKMEVNDKFLTARYRDKRDLLEQVLKSIKFQYDALSRKVTLLAPNTGRGETV